MLETKIELLTAAITHLTIAIEQANNLKPVVDQIAEKQATLAPTPAPTVAPAPAVVPAAVVSAPVVAAAPVMPPPPVFATAPTPAANALPFNDANTLVSYVMGVYRQIGAAKGAGIQNVLTSLGAANLTDVKPEQYSAFHAGIEQLKSS